MNPDWSKMEIYRVVNCPSDELAYTNRAILNPSDPFAHIAHIAIRKPKEHEAFVFTVATDDAKVVKKGEIAFNYISRKWTSFEAFKEIEAAPYKFDIQSQCLRSITFLTDFLITKEWYASMEYDTDKMAEQFSRLFVNQGFTVGQLISFSFKINQKKVTFSLTVKQMEAINIQENSNTTVEIGLTTGNTLYLFERQEGSGVKLFGGKTGEVAAPKIFNQDLDLTKLGVGGLGDQFNLIFRRAFISRLLPPQFAAEAGTEHIRGILLYGPPGTGKTLIARQIGKMLLAREPKIVNGPEVLNKFVGESEANIRKLFAEAEAELAKMGINSGLHVIIFDEIDSICKSRGSSGSSSGAGDNVVNQLLTKIDGVESLPNVLLIGMTNRRDLIDDALLRPGRLELQIEIGLPNRQGRREIFEIHTSKLRKKNLLHQYVDLEDLADRTKNYSGAEIAGLIKAATSLAFNKVLKPGENIKIDQAILDSIKITQQDFLCAMKYDIKPALGASEDRLNVLAKPMIDWDSQIQLIRSELFEITKLVRDGLVEPLGLPYFVLLTGQSGSGLTTIAANAAKQTEFPFIRVFSAEAIAGETESFKIKSIKKLFEDASQSELSCVIIDDLDIILDYNEFGPRFSQATLHVLLTMMIKDLADNRQMLVLCTCSNQKCLDDLKLRVKFSCNIRVPSLTEPDQVLAVLTDMQENDRSSFTKEQNQELAEALASMSFQIGIKRFVNLIGSARRDIPRERVNNFIKRMIEM